MMVKAFGLPVQTGPVDIFGIAASLGEGTAHSPLLQPCCCCMIQDKPFVQQPILYAVYRVITEKTTPPGIIQGASLSVEATQDCCINTKLARLRSLLADVMPPACL